MTRDGFTIKTRDDLSDERFTALLALLTPDGDLAWGALTGESARALATNAAVLGVR